MGRASKLTPQQWVDIERRVLAGEGVRELAKEYEVSPGLISQKGFSKHSKQVRDAAQKLAEGRMAVAALPVVHQHTAVTISDEIMGLQVDVLAATRISAKSGLRLHSLANSELQKVDDAAVLTEEASVNALKTVAVLTKMGNDALHPALNLLSANKDRVQKLDERPDPDAPQMHGVLQVPGLAASSDAWAKTKGAKP